MCVPNSVSGDDTACQSEPWTVASLRFGTPPPTFKNTNEWIRLAPSHVSERDFLSRVEQLSDAGCSPRAAPASCPAYSTREQPLLLYLAGQGFDERPAGW